MASLTLKHVDRAFPNGYEAVKDLNFQIEDGEFVILTGPSGSGKSAVMRMIAGLDEVKNGGKCECPLYYQDNWIVFSKLKERGEHICNYN